MATRQPRPDACRPIDLPARRRLSPGSLRRESSAAGASSHGPAMIARHASGRLGAGKSAPLPGRSRGGRLFGA